ncbi:MAG: hypothetical protein ISR65_07175 [Bacteriovoracaceae bacterium]|nr:hypothetical protein [Bacteriovoracaceae bacterium]
MANKKLFICFFTLSLVISASIKAAEDKLPCKIQSIKKRCKKNKKHIKELQGIMDSIAKTYGGPTGNILDPEFVKKRFAYDAKVKKKLENKIKNINEDFDKPTVDSAAMEKKIFETLRKRAKKRLIKKGISTSEFMANFFGLTQAPKVAAKAKKIKKFTNKTNKQSPRQLMPPKMLAKRPVKKPVNEEVTIYEFGNAAILMNKDISIFQQLSRRYILLGFPNGPDK